MADGENLSNLDGFLKDAYAKPPKKKKGFGVLTIQNAKDEGKK